MEANDMAVHGSNSSLNWTSQHSDTGDELEDCQVCNEVKNLTKEWFILQLILPIVTFIANSLTCYALCRARAMKFYLRMIFLNLNLTDLISCLVYLYHIVFAWNSFQVNTECVARHVIYIGTVILNLLIVCFMTVDRSWSIFLPYLYERLIGIRYVLFTVGFVWAIAVLYVALGFSFMRQNIEGCFYPLLMRSEIHLFYSVAGLVVICLIVVFNGIMYGYARAQILKVAQTMVGDAREQYKASTNLKAATTTLIIVAPFVLLNTPTYCLMIYFVLDPDFTKTGQALYTLNALTNLAFMNSLVNPFIYIWRSKHVREILVNASNLKPCTCGKNRPRSQSTTTHLASRPSVSDQMAIGSKEQMRPVT